MMENIFAGGVRIVNKSFLTFMIQNTMLKEEVKVFQPVLSARLQTNAKIMQIHQEHKQKMPIFTFPINAHLMQLMKPNGFGKQTEMSLMVTTTMTMLLRILV